MIFGCVHGKIHCDDQQYRFETVDQCARHAISATPRQQVYHQHNRGDTMIAFIVFTILA